MESELEFAPLQIAVTDIEGKTSFQYAQEGDPFVVVYDGDKKVDLLIFEACTEERPYSVIYKAKGISLPVFDAGLVDIRKLELIEVIDLPNKFVMNVTPPEGKEFQLTYTCFHTEFADDNN